MKTKLTGSLLIIATLIMIWIMLLTGNSLKTPTTPYGIINLEIAANVEKTKEIVQTWDKNNTIAAATKNTLYDFIFITCYVSLFYFLLRQVEKQFSSVNLFNKLSRYISYAAVMAGVLDILENIGILKSLSGNITNGITLFTFSTSIIKWILVAVCILWLLFSVAVILFRRKPVRI